MTETIPRDSCGICRFYEGAGSYCRRHAPIVAMEVPSWRHKGSAPVPVTHWPMVSSLYWCGDFEERPEDRAKREREEWDGEFPVADD